MPDKIAIETVEAQRPRKATSRGSVFIVQVAADGLNKYQKAERFGDLVPLMQRDAFPDNAESQIRYMRNLMKNALSQFNPARDYVLLRATPSPLRCASSRCPASR
jgi:hypothetical protein